ncbi:hypothetical protein [Nonomuraea pusilla]|uniref:hypothetical protein n=1 Tax=Nonomuraea pusilla TaxID=46177 RepID=UPI003327876E
MPPHPFSVLVGRGVAVTFLRGSVLGLARSSLLAGRVTLAGGVVGVGDVLGLLSRPYGSGRLLWPPDAAVPCPPLPYPLFPYPLFP